MYVELKRKDEAHWLTPKEFFEGLGTRAARAANTSPGYYCSKCKQNNDRKTNFCPNCGRKMYIKIDDNTFISMNGRNTNE